MKTATRSCFRAELLLALALTGCATVSSPRVVTPTRSVPIVFRDAGRTRPLVRLQVGAMQGWFLLDTGAAGHMMSDWFFAAAFPGQKPRGRAARAIDFAGVPIPLTLVGALGAGWDDGEQRQLEFSVGPFSRPDEPDPLAGILSPQALLEDGSLELDFAGQALRWWAAPPTRGVGYSLASQTLRACRGGSHGEVIYAWAMGVDGQGMWAMMDTGSPVTAVSPNSPVGAALQPSSRPVHGGRGASNAPVTTRMAMAQLNFGGVPWVGEVALMRLPLEDCGALALLGMNLLRRCSVVLSGDAGTVLCSP